MRSVNENGDKSGLRVEILSIVHHSRRRYRPPAGQENAGEGREPAKPLPQRELDKNIFCQI